MYARERIYSPNSVRLVIDKTEGQIDTIQNRIVENMKSWKNSDKLVGLIKMKNNSKNWS